MYPRHTSSFLTALATIVLESSKCQDLKRKICELLVHGRAREPLKYIAAAARCASAECPDDIKLSSRSVSQCRVTDLPSCCPLTATRCIMTLSGRSNKTCTDLFGYGPTLLDFDTVFPSRTNHRLHFYATPCLR
jgi:hypothetical protein